MDKSYGPKRAEAIQVGFLPKEPFKRGNFTAGSVRDTIQSVAGPKKGQSPERFGERAIQEDCPAHILQSTVVPFW
jgi:hypothetical protein